jgi:hypothetical protein
MTTVLAIVCVRNETLHVRRCLRDLIADGIDVVLVDNESTDDTVAKARAFLGRGLLGIERLPWHGAFSLTDQLALKRSIAARSAHEWIVHADADERLEAIAHGKTLRDAITAADAGGYTCINFHEFAFVPLAGEDFAAENYAERMRTYYFFQPTYPRLMRAWRRGTAYQDPAAGGHLVAGPNVRRFPVDLNLRHYIALSEAHGRAKYVGRRFAAEDRVKGWHQNRVTVAADHLVVQERPELRRLPSPDSRAFDTSAPVGRHFWEWGDGPDGAGRLFRADSAANYDHVLGV